MTRPSPRPHLALAQPDRAPAPSVDRRSLLSGLGALTLLAAPASVLRAVEPAPTQPLPVCSPPSGMPAHLASLCASDPNSFAVHAWGAAEASGAGGTAGLLDRLEEFLTAHKRELSTSPFVLNMAALERSGNVPTTIEGLTQVMVNSTLCSAGDVGGALCIEGPLGESCISTGCDEIPGDCWLTPKPLRDFVEPCECVREVSWWEVALMALLLLLLIATPGPDEIPAMVAAASRLIVRVAPAIG
jgi:hypothetical protein